MSDELTDKQMEQISDINNAAYTAVCDTLGLESVEWNMEWIGELADAIASVCVRHFGKTEMEVYPYHTDGEEEIVSKDRLTPTQKTTYLHTRGIHCPFCGSDNINADGIDCESYLQDVDCNDCGNEWQEQYRMIDVTAENDPPVLMASIDLAEVFPGDELHND